MFLQRYTEGGAGELTVGQFQSALRSAGERCSAEQVKQLMGELLVLCGSCNAMLCQPTGGKARLTEGCSFRKKLD